MISDFVAGMIFATLKLFAGSGIAEFASNYEIVKITTDVMENK